MVLRVLSLIAVLALSACALLRPPAGASSPPPHRALSVPPPSLIPMPARLTAQAGSFTVNARTVILAAAPAGPAARYFAHLLDVSRGLHLALRAQGDGAIRFLLRPGVSAGREGYHLDVGPSGATVTASTPAGLFYGGITLWQLLTQTPGKAQHVVIASIRIADWPRFRWRGLMLDSARHFEPVAFIKTLLDAMAIHKLNVLQWHLTDDQGWRIQIKRYPRLTSVGAWRVPAGPAAAKDIDPATGKPRRYGGFYTQEQIRGIVAYAAARHIMVVPEIEMPGHALAAIAAYPGLASVAHPPRTPSSDWGVFPYLYAPRPATFRFLENVLREVMALFPSPYIDVGGDEAVKDQWKANPQVQAQIRRLGLKNEDALQSWFIGRIGRFLQAHGRKLIGWDEILEGGLPPDATVMSWRGIAGAVAAAKAGHDAVLAPAPILYFDNRQSALPDEPSGRGTVVTLKDVYEFDPAPVSLTPAQRSHILGLQGNIWTEHIRGAAQVEYMAFPRAAALAERAWSPPQASGWKGFEQRLVAEFARYRALGIVYAPSVFVVRMQARLSAHGHQAVVQLSNQGRFGTIHYRLGAGRPDLATPLYAGPIHIALPAQISAASYADGRRISPIAIRGLTVETLLTRSSAELLSCHHKLMLNVADDAPRHGRRAVFLVDILDPCWIDPKVDLDGVSAITAAVGQVPFNYQVGAAAAEIPLHRPHSRFGELEVHLDRCDGPLIASLGLGPARHRDEVTVLKGPVVPQEGVHDLCLLFTRRAIAPIWTIDWLRLDTSKTGQ